VKVCCTAIILRHVIKVGYMSGSFKGETLGRGKSHMNDENYIYSRLVSNVHCLARIESTVTIKKR